MSSDSCRGSGAPVEGQATQVGLGWVRVVKADLLAMTGERGNEALSLSALCS